jgi:hypothetical protein
MSVSNMDPKNINGRLYEQVARLLDDMEAADRDDTMTFPQRINALIAVGRVQIMFAGLRKAEAREHGAAGSAVRKYAAAFKSPNAARRRAADAGSDDDTVIQLASTGDAGGDDAA